MTRYFSPETRAKMRVAKLGKPLNALQLKNHAARWTPELREKARKKTLANPQRYWLGKKRGPTPQSVREKMSAANKGRRLSTGMTGKRHSTETRSRMRQARLGRHPSAETLAKMSAVMIGKRTGPRHPHSPATRAKISAMSKRTARSGRDHHMWGKTAPHMAVASSDPPMRSASPRSLTDAGGPGNTKHDASTSEHARIVQIFSSPRQVPSGKSRAGLTSEAKRKFGSSGKDIRISPSSWPLKMSLS